jgi:hypothetical protein
LSAHLQRPTSQIRSITPRVHLSRTLAQNKEIEIDDRISRLPTNHRRGRRVKLENDYHWRHRPMTPLDCDGGIFYIGNAVSVGMV